MSQCKHGVQQCDQCERDRLALRVLLLGIGIGIVIGSMAWSIATVVARSV